MKKIVAIGTACLLGAACANRPDSIHASYVSHEKYIDLDCSSLEARMFSTRNELEKQSEVQNAKATGDAIGVFLFGIPFSKLEGDVEGDIARLKGEIEAIDTAMIKNKCASDASRAVASVPTTAAVASPSASKPGVSGPKPAPRQDASPAQPPRWVAINDPAELRAIYSDTTIRGTAHTRNSPGGIPFVGQFRSDGTGVLTINGENIPRIWRVQGNDQVCATDRTGTNCYRLQRNANNGDEILGENVKSSVIVRFTVQHSAVAVKNPDSRSVEPVAPYAGGSPRVPTPEPVASLRDAAPAPPSPANAKLPAAGTTWVYRYADRIYGRGNAEIVVRIESSSDSSVYELVTTGYGASKRVVNIGDSQVLKLPLSDRAFALELAPYLVARSDEGASLGSPSITGYPHGPSGLSPWRIRVTKRGWEQVSVPAGSYRALRIQIDGKRERQDLVWGQDGTFSIVAWYAPEVKRLVRLEHKTWELFSRKLNEHKVLELTSFRPPS